MTVTPSPENQNDAHDCVCPASALQADGMAPAADSCRQRGAEELEKTGVESGEDFDKRETCPACETATTKVELSGAPTGAGYTLSVDAPGAVGRPASADAETTVDLCTSPMAATHISWYTSAPIVQYVYSTETFGLGSSLLGCSTETFGVPRGGEGRIQIIMSVLSV